MSEKILHWFIQKPIAHNCPLRHIGAVFQEFEPTVHEMNCEWFKVVKASDHDLAIRKKDLEIQILRDRLYKNLAMSWKDDSEGRNKAYQNINTEIEKAKWEVV